MTDLVNTLKQPGSKKWIIIGGGGVAAFIAYRYYKSKSAAATTTSATGGLATDTASGTDTSIDPSTGIPYSEEEAYGGIPSGLTFNAQTGKFQPAASTIVGDVPYSSNSGQSTTPTDTTTTPAAPTMSYTLGDYIPNAFYQVNGPNYGYIAGVLNNGTQTVLTGDQWAALQSQGAKVGTITTGPAIPAKSTSPAVPVSK